MGLTASVTDNAAFRTIHESVKSAKSACPIGGICEICVADCVWGNVSRVVEEAAHGSHRNGDEKWAGDQFVNL